MHEQRRGVPRRWNFLRDGVLPRSSAAERPVYRGAPDPCRWPDDDRFDLDGVARCWLCGLWLAVRRCIAGRLVQRDRGRHDLRASTCYPGTNYDTFLRIYTGENCFPLTCVGLNNDAGSMTCPQSPNRSVVEWCSSPGRVYRVFVHGFGARLGTTNLE